MRPLSCSDCRMPNRAVRICRREVALVYMVCRRRSTGCLAPGGSCIGASSCLLSGDGSSEASGRGVGSNASFHLLLLICSRSGFEMSVMRTMLMTAFLNFFLISVFGMIACFRSANCSLLHRCENAICSEFCSATC